MLPARWIVARPRWRSSRRPCCWPAAHPAGDDAETGRRRPPRPFYPQLATDPDIPVVEDIPYSTRDGQTQYLDGCFPEDEVVGSSQRAARGDRRHPRRQLAPRRQGQHQLARYLPVVRPRRVRRRLGELPPRAAMGVPGAARRRAGCRALAARPRHRRRGTTSTPTGSGCSAASAGGNLAALLGTSGIRRLDQRRPRRRRRGPQRPRPTLVTPIVASTGADPDFVQVQLSTSAARASTTAIPPSARSPITYADETDPPFLIAHSHGGVHPARSQSERLVARCATPASTVDFLTVEGTLHSIAISTTR